MYVIKQIWIDTLENSRSEAVGYRAVGFVETEGDAKMLVEQGGMLSSERFKWPLIWGDEPRFKYEKVETFKKPTTCTCFSEGRCLVKMDCVFIGAKEWLCPATS